MSEARDIVRAAARKTRVHALRVWLHDDPRGAWELQAADLMRKLREKHGENLVPDAHDQCAQYLAYLGAKALLEHAS